MGKNNTNNDNRPSSFLTSLREQILLIIKSKKLYVIVFFLVILIGTILIYSRSNTIQKETIAPDQTSSPTSDWKTFTNTTLKFSIENPVEWFIKEDVGIVTLSNSEEVFISKFLSKGQTKLEIYNRQKEDEGLTELNNSNFFDLNNQIWTDRKNKSNNEGILTKTYEIIYVNGIETVREIVQGSGLSEGPNLLTVHYLFPDPTDELIVWIIRSEILLDDPEADTLQAQKNRILSTFKFMNNSSNDAQFCGGIQGKVCPLNYDCKLDGPHPDASGTCVMTKNDVGYVCPITEWVDCMPGPNMGVKLECTSEYLDWSKENCPNFKGGAF